MAENFPKLIILTGPEEGQTIPLPASGQLSIGRSDENELILSDSSVSRQHALLTGSEGRYFIKDYGSRNGTILEGKKLEAEEEVSLSHLDEFRVGIYEMRFVQKPFTESELKAKKKESKSHTEAAAQAQSKTKKADAPKPAQKAISEKVAASNPVNIEAESLIDDLIKEKEQVEKKLPGKNKKTTIAIVLASLLLIALLSASIIWFQQRSSSTDFAEDDDEIVEDVQQRAAKTKP